MRANAIAPVLASAAVAVIALNLIARRESVAFQPRVHFAASGLSVATAEHPSVLRTVIVGVVDGEEIRIGLSAARTAIPAVGDENLVAYSPEFATLSVGVRLAACQTTCLVVGNGLAAPAPATLSKLGSVSLSVLPLRFSAISTELVSF
jgi:hypothetical protein